MFHKNLKKGFANTYKFSNPNINKFILLLQKCVYSYEYMDDWEKFNEISLLVKEDFYSHLNMEDFTDAGYVDRRRVCKDFQTKALVEFFDLYVQNDTLLEADVFKNFWNICLEIYDFDSIHFLLHQV